MKPSNSPSLVGRILIPLCVLLACPFLSRAQAVKKSPPPSPPQTAKPAPPKPAATKPAATPAPGQHPMPELRQQHPAPQQPQPKPSAQPPQQQHQVPEPQKPAPGRTPLANPATKASTLLRRILLQRLPLGFRSLPTVALSRWPLTQRLRQRQRRPCLPQGSHQPPRPAHR